MAQTCDNCHKRQATEIWAPGGTLAYIHGIYSRWCRYCVCEAQLNHARERAAEIPALERELYALGEG